MALAKPQKSKASAPTQPVGGYHSKSAAHDPCCVPGAVPDTSNTAWKGGDSPVGPAPAATHHIIAPGAH